MILLPRPYASSSNYLLQPNGPPRLSQAFPRYIFDNFPWRTPPGRNSFQNPHDHPLGWIPPWEFVQIFLPRATLHREHKSPAALTYQRMRQSHPATFRERVMPEFCRFIWRGVVGGRADTGKPQTTGLCHLLPPDDTRLAPLIFPNRPIHLVGLYYSQLRRHPWQHDGSGLDRRESG